MSGDGIRVLVVDDQEHHAQAVAESLERMGCECVVAAGGPEGAAKIDEADFDVIITDLRMEGVDGLAILRKAKLTQPQAEVVLVTGHSDVKSVVTAMQSGAATYLTKPVDLHELRAVVEKVAERQRLTRTNQDLRRQLDERFGFEGLVGNSRQMHDVLDRLKQIAPTAATVLIQGETGTGKDVVAKAIHFNSPRRAKPFVPLNCTALNENLLEDELFGHEPGAFTGAERLRKGKFEFAHGGTLFLDEIGDMPLSLQAKLLRVLEDGQIVRVGGNEPIKVNVRVLSATHRDLDDAVAKKLFRQDLYYRLKVCTIKLPALRDRRDDIPLLAAHFLKEFAQKYEKPVTGIAADVRRMFLAHDWPGNVRELRNVVESMVVQDRDGILGVDDLPESEALQTLQPPAAPAVNGNTGLVGKPLELVERYYIEKALELTEGNREEAARLLQIGERTLYRKIKEYKLETKRKSARADKAD